MNKPGWRIKLILDSEDFKTFNTLNNFVSLDKFFWSVHINPGSDRVNNFKFIVLTFLDLLRYFE